MQDTRPVHGVGINDNLYPVVVNGKRTKEYNLWTSMLKRCYSRKCHAKQPTYADCTVSRNFKNYSYFNKWCQSQIGFDIDGFQMDKDILVTNNRIYSEDTCAFVPREINVFFLDRKAAKGEYPIGVTFHKQANKYKAQCRIDAKHKHLGLFTTPEEAHAVYKQFKENLCKEVARKWQSQIDSRVYDAMINWSLQTSASHRIKP